MVTDNNEEIIRQIERFADRHNFSDTGVSRFLVSNPNFLKRLREGGNLFSRTEKRIKEKMKEHDALQQGGKDGK